MGVGEIVALVAQGGWGIAALFCYFFVEERRQARRRDAEIFALFQKQLQLLDDGRSK